ncbi:MAG: hypothetical protein NTV39_03050 [Candidatus Saccharibacteria bacterium]|nr:hypothetical protein [Candidatus Saccharibacteria bacterium]
MRDRMYDELALERSIKEYFGVDIDISHVILYKVPVSRTAFATLFLTTKKQLLLHVTGQSKLLLGDVKKLVSRMGLKTELYFPPHGHPDYFNEIGRNKFHEVFPGRKNIVDSDINFYRLLAPYNPALALISEVKEGVVYQFDSDATSDWRVAAKFAYRRIRTS